MKNHYKIYFLGLLGFGLLLVPIDVMAGLINPLAVNGASTPVAIPVIIGNAVKAVLGLVGMLALLYFIIGGFYFLTAAGKEERVKKGQSILTWASVGLVLAFTSYAIIDFLVRSFEGFGT